MEKMPVALMTIKVPCGPVVAYYGVLAELDLSASNGFIRFKD